MPYDDFKLAFTAEMMIRSERDGVTVVPQQVTKVNQTLDALAFSRDGENAATLIYLQDLYEQYQNGTSIGTLAEQVGQYMQIKMDEIPEIPNIDRDFIMENIYLAVINADMNRDYLSDIPHEYIEDLAVVPKVRISEEASFSIRKDMLKAFGLTRQELFQAAYTNMEQMTYKCETIAYFLFGMDSSFELLPDSPSNDIYVLTNQSGIEGASAILSQKAMKEAREKLGEDFFILPASRHEVLLVPRSLDLPIRDLTDMVRNVNRIAVQQNDLLSDNIYRYNSKAGSIKMLEPRADVPEKTRSQAPIL